MKKHIIIALLMMQSSMIFAEPDEPIDVSQSTVKQDTKPLSSEDLEKLYQEHHKLAPTTLDTVKGYATHLWNMGTGLLGKLTGSAKVPVKPNEPKPVDTTEADRYAYKGNPTNTSGDTFSLSGDIGGGKEDEDFVDIFTDAVSEFSDNNNDFHEAVKSITVTQFLNETGMTEEQFQKECNQNKVSADQLNTVYQNLGDKTLTLNTLSSLNDSEVTQPIQDYLKENHEEFSQVKKSWYKNLRILERTKNLLKKTGYYLSPIRAARNTYIVMRNAGGVIKEIVKVPVVAVSYIFCISLPLIIDAHRLALGVGSLGLYIFGEMYIRALINRRYEYVKQRVLNPTQEHEEPEPTELGDLEFPFVTNKGIDLFNKVLSKLYGKVEAPLQEGEVVTISFEEAQEELGVTKKQFNDLCDQHEVKGANLSSTYAQMSQSEFDLSQGLNGIGDTSISDPMKTYLDKNPKTIEQLKQGWPRARKFLNMLSSATNAVGRRFSVIPGARGLYCVVRNAAAVVVEVVKVPVVLTGYTSLVYAPMLIDTARVGLAAAGLGTYIFGEMYIRAQVGGKLNEIGTRIMHPTQEYVAPDAPQFNKIDFPFITTSGIRKYNTLMKFLYPPKPKKSAIPA